MKQGTPTRLRVWDADLGRDRLQRNPWQHRASELM